MVHSPPQGANPISKQEQLDGGLARFLDTWGGLAICAVFFMEAVEARGGVGDFRRERPLVARWALYYTLIFWVVAFGVFDESQFIYFQF